MAAEPDPPPPTGATQEQEAAFQKWYHDVILAHPERYDPAHFTEGQAREWEHLWDPKTGGFRSSKVDRNGVPIPGSSYAHPDECPPGMTAYGQNMCVPVNEIPGQGRDAQSQFDQQYRFDPNASDQLDFNLPDVPEFKPPNLTDDPGYQFRLKQGTGALESSAAARGILNTGSTLQGVQQLGQDMASQEYGNAWNRYKDRYAPLLAQWQMRSGAARDKAFANWNRGWEKYQFGNNDEFRRQQMILNSQPPGY